MNGMRKFGLAVSLVALVGINLAIASLILGGLTGQVDLYRFPFEFGIVLAAIGGLASIIWVILWMVRN